MSPESMIAPAILSYTAIMAAVVLLHLLFGKWPELVRRGIGATTILLVTFIPAKMGFIDFWTWLFIALAFFMAGAALAALVVIETDNRYRNSLEKALNCWIEGNHARTNQTGGKAAGTEDS
jgi:hypothetical protein